MAKIINDIIYPKGHPNNVCKELTFEADKLINPEVSVIELL